MGCTDRTGYGHEEPTKTRASELRVCLHRLADAPTSLLADAPASLLADAPASLLADAPASLLADAPTRVAASTCLCCCLAYPRRQGAKGNSGGGEKGGNSDGDEKDGNSGGGEKGREQRRRRARREQRRGIDGHGQWCMGRRPFTLAGGAEAGLRRR